MVEVKLGIGIEECFYKGVYFGWRRRGEQKCAEMVRDVVATSDHCF